MTESELLSPLSAQLIYLVADGTHVKKGQLVARFGVQKQADSMASQELALKQSEIDLAVTRSGGDSQQEADQMAALDAGLRVRQAELALQDLKESRDKAAIAETATTLATLKEQVAILNKEIPTYEKLLAAGQISQEKLQQAVALRKEYQIQQKAIEAKQRTLLRGPTIQDIKKQEAQLQVAKSQRISAEKTLVAYKLTRKIDELDNQLDIQNAQKLYTKFANQVRSGTIYAPQSGLLVYETIWAADHQVPVTLGTSLDQGARFARISELTEPIVRADLNGIDVWQIKVGQRAQAVLDALPGKVFEGRVVKIARIGSRRRRDDANDLRSFEIQVRLLKDDPLLKPGLTANLTIHTANPAVSLAGRTR